ncbi:MAG: tetratricopeptide repeat protein, partial [Gemmatimonadetes bacterium]|nr:tetratricopeptide repeat protein [Gemmatimonadota bacterium]
VEQARTLERLRQDDRAVALFERILQEAPDNRSALNGVLRLYFRLEAFDKAIPLLETHIQRSPDNIRFRGRLAEALFGSGRDAEAEEQIRILQDLFPESESAVNTVAYLHFGRQAYDRAIQTCLAGRQRLGKPDAFALALAGFYTSAFDIPGAVREYVRWLTLNPRQQGIVSDQIDQLTVLGSQELVERALREAVSEHRGSKDAHDLLGNYYLRYDKPLEALAEYREADRLDGSSGTYLARFAEWALREGHTQDAIDTYRELIRQAASDTMRAEASTGLARALQENGSIDQAAGTYRKIIAQYPETRYREEAMARLAGLHLAHFQDARQALDTYRSLLAHAPATKFREQAMFGIAESYVVLGSLEDALAQYNRIGDPEAGFPEVETRARTTFHRGELALFKGRWDDALERFHETADRYADSPYANDALEWTILIAEGRQGGDRSLADYVRSVLLRRQFRDREALEACKRFVEEHAESLIVDTVILDIGVILDQLGKPYEALAALRDLIERHPDSRRVVTARRRVAEILETKIGDIPQALTEYETLLVSHPDHFNNDAVRRKIRELTENHPPMP